MHKYISNTDRNQYYQYCIHVINGSDTHSTMKTDLSQNEADNQLITIKVGQHNKIIIKNMQLLRTVHKIWENTKILNYIT